MKGKTRIVLLIFSIFLILCSKRVYSECIPHICESTGRGDCNWETEYCVAYCCVLKPTPPGSSPTPGGSYEYQSCPVGQALSCGTVAEAGSQNKKQPADGFAKRISGWESPHPIIRLNIRWSLLTVRFIPRRANPSTNAARIREFLDARRA